MPEQKYFCSGILLYAVCNMPVLKMRIFFIGDAHYLWQRNTVSLKVVFGMPFCEVLQRAFFCAVASFAEDYFLRANAEFASISFNPSKVLLKRMAPAEAWVIF